MSLRKVRLGFNAEGGMTSVSNRTGKERNDVLQFSGRSGNTVGHLIASCLRTTSQSSPSTIGISYLPRD